MSAPTRASTASPSLASGETPSLVDILGRRALIQVALLAALVIWAYWNPIRQTLVTRWIHDPDWGHGWLVPLFSLYFLHAHRTMLIGVRRETNYLGLALMVLFIGAYASSYLWYTITIARPFYMLATAFSAVLFLGGWGVVRLVWFPIAFLIFAVPIPEHIYVDMTMPLRKIASEIGGYVLPVILPGLHAEVQGVVIEYSYNGTPGVLNVEQACSGMRLMMAFVTLGVAMAYLGDRPLWQRLVMVACCVPIAVFCNIIRVTITGFLHIMKDEPLGKAWDFEALSRGTPHALLGIFMLPIAFGLFALVSWILSNLFVEEASADPVAKERPA